MKKIILIIILFSLIFSCTNNLNDFGGGCEMKVPEKAIKQNTKDTVKEPNVLYKDTAVFESENIFLKVNCYEIQDTFGGYGSSNICYYSNAKNFNDLYTVFKYNYDKSDNYDNSLLSTLPKRDTFLEGNYPITITYVLPNDKTDSLAINLFFPGGEDYYYFYTRNDSNFIDYTSSPD